MKYQRGFFEITTGQRYFMLLVVMLAGYGAFRLVEWLLHHISFHWG